MHGNWFTCIYDINKVYVHMCWNGIFQHICTLCTVSVHTHIYMRSPSQLWIFKLWVQIWMTATLIAKLAVSLQLVWKLLQSECVFVSFGFSLSDLHLKMIHAYECVTHQLLSWKQKKQGLHGNVQTIRLSLRFRFRAMIEKGTARQVLLH